jgi:DNA-binding MarR family transcriptional regulator
MNMSSRSNRAQPSVQQNHSHDAEARVATTLMVALARVHRQLRALSTNDVTASQISALARIKQLGPLRMGALAEAEGTTAVTMCKVINGLEERKLITRVPDSLDGRASLVQLSRQGETLLGDLRARSTEALGRALAELNDAEHESVSSAIPVLERLSDILLNQTGR